MDDQPDFLRSDPPPWAARALAWLLIGLFAAAVVASVVIRLPETVRSSFVLVPARGADPLRAARSGTVATVAVAEGQAVTKGDVAFVIRSASVGDRSSELGSLQTRLTGTAEARGNARQRHESQRQADSDESRRLGLRAGHLAQKLDEQHRLRAVREARFRGATEIQQNEIAITQKEIDFKRQHHAVAAELSARFERSYGDGIVSWLDYNNRRLEAARLAVELQQLERALETSRLKLQQLSTDRDTQELEWTLTVAAIEAERHDVRTALDKVRHTAAARDAEYRETDRRLTEEAARARIRTASLREELAQSRGSDLRLTAPCGGTVLRLAVKAAGAVVQEGDVLAELACEDEKLQAEVTVLPAGVGLVKAGQAVKLLYDAFPYQRYGVRYGTVRWVSPSAVEVRDRSVLRVRADLADTAIVVRGEPRPLMAGMTGQAHIVVGTRSLIDFAFEPVRRLRESLADRPAR
jgi:HlyD family type I secretion membrane fusion protein